MRSGRWWSRVWVHVRRWWWVVDEGVVNLAPELTDTTKLSMRHRLREKEGPKRLCAIVAVGTQAYLIYASANGGRGTTVRSVGR